MAIRSILKVERLEGRLLPATFSVLNTADSGAGSLRQAILEANNNPGEDTVAFDVGSGGVQTLKPLSPLPPITDTAVVDGTTQPGFVGSPLIVLNGSNAGASANGLVLSAPGTTVRSLVINGFKQAGIRITHDATVVGSYVGMNATGSATVANNIGIVVDGGTRSVIGGVNASARNVISGNTEVGIQIIAGRNQIQGNYIGADATGVNPVPNENGIYIAIGSDGNTIGGETLGSGNLISGNKDYGVYLASNSNHLYGNRIGTNATGTAPLGNSRAGVFVFQSKNNRIGGPSPGMGNLVSGNELGTGIVIWGGYDGSGPNATDNVVKGNRIGTDPTGAFAVPNQTGISISSNAPRNTLGGPEPGARNLVSGNTRSGIVVLSGDCVIQGNYVGTNGAGTTPMGNGIHGVEVSAPRTMIGGMLAEEGNLISANGAAGIQLYNEKNSVLHNFIGTDVTGTVALPNEYGMTLDSWDSVIGLPGAGNLISGNRLDGIVVSFSYASHNTILSNQIGTDVTGLIGLGNGKSGITIYFAPDTNIGNAMPGSGNVISGNGAAGIDIYGQTALRNHVSGNSIGTNATGTQAIPNLGSGVLVHTNAKDTVVGGVTAGARNLISGNKSGGITLASSTSFTLIQGNYIGTDFTGTRAIGNHVGMLVSGENSIIGGTVPGAGNLISGNVTIGVDFGPASDNVLQGNLIGTDVTGTNSVSNSTGISFTASTKNMVGGLDSAARNVISGNSVAGVSFGSGANQNKVQGNYIGTDGSGLKALANGKGVSISGAHSNTIGGTVAAARNVISGNHGVGLEILGPTSTSGNIVQGNWVGLNGLGTAALPNANGILIDGASSMTLGGIASGTGNVVAGNVGWGLMIAGTTNQVTVAGNLVGSAPSGLAGIPNGLEGILVTGGASNIIGGTSSAARNLISGNTGAGIRISGGAVAVQGNYIGTDLLGNAPLGNFHGVVIDAVAVTVGGTTAAARNVISGNLHNGVVLQGVSNSVQGNFIGATPDGTTALPNEIGVLVADGTHSRVGGLAAGAGNLISGNTQAGISIAPSVGVNLRVEGNWIGINGSGTGPLPNQTGVTVTGRGHLIGGALPAARNVISGNAAHGVLVSGRGITVRGNFIGTDVSGTLSVGNGFGVVIAGRRNALGGTSSGSDNLVSGNFQDGVLITGERNTVQGNRIGTDILGTGGIGNGDAGIRVESTGNTIGGLTAEAGNVIAFNGTDGVIIDAGDANAVRRNSVFGNTGLGIALVNNGNHLQESPSLSHALWTPSSINVAGALTSDAFTSFAVEFFVSAVCDPSGFGEGERYLGYATVLTDANGEAEFDLSLPGYVNVGEFITATATHPNNDTSMFSGCVMVQPSRSKLVPANSLRLHVQLFGLFGDVNAQRAPRLSTVQASTSPSQVTQSGTMHCASVEPAGAAVENRTHVNREYCHVQLQTQTWLVFIEDPELEVPLEAGA